MSKTTTLLLVVAFLATVAYAELADTVTLTNASFYKEKGYGKIVSAGDASLGLTISRKLIAGKNSKTNYYVYQTNTPTDAENPDKGGTITIVFKKLDVNKLALTDDAAVSVSGFKWGGEDSDFDAGATTGNNVTLVGVLSPEPNATNPILNVYAYLINLDKNEKYELLVASGSYTDATTGSVPTVNAVWSSGSLTYILYTITSTTSTGGKTVLSVVTLKGGKLGTPSVLKEVSWATAAAHETYAGYSATGQNLVVVFRTVASSKNTEIVYPFTVTEKEVKAGTTATLNIQVTDTNDYEFSSIHAHVEGRWVAVYKNDTTADTTTTYNVVAKASNDTTFKTLQSYTLTATTSKSISAQTYFAGLILAITDTTTTDDGSTKTYSYQTVNGDLVTLGTKMTYLTVSGKYTTLTLPAPQRLGDNKALNLLVTQIKRDTTVNPTATTYEGVYFGQIFQKSFGATLQSVLAVCSLMLAALFIF